MLTSETENRSNKNIGDTFLALLRSEILKFDSNSPTPSHNSVLNAVLFHNHYDGFSPHTFTNLAADEGGRKKQIS